MLRQMIVEEQFMLGPVVDDNAMQTPDVQCCSLGRLVPRLRCLRPSESPCTARQRYLTCQIRDLHACAAGGCEVLMATCDGGLRAHC